MRRTLALATALVVTACAGRAVPPERAVHGHPADPDAPSSAFVPASDHLAISARDVAPSGTLPSVEATRDHAAHDTASPSQATAEPSTSPIASDAVVTSYLALSSALVKDDFAAAAATLAPLRRAADAMSHDTNAAVAIAAAHVREAVPTDPREITDLRTGFQQISETLTSLLRVAPPTDVVAPVIRRAYCPMADAAWLQTETEIENPYMGAKMPHCGRVVEVIETRTSKGGK